MPKALTKSDIIVGQQIEAIASFDCHLTKGKQYTILCIDYKSDTVKIRDDQDREVYLYCNRFTKPNTATFSSAVDQNAYEVYLANTYRTALENELLRNFYPRDLCKHPIDLPTTTTAPMLDLEALIEAIFRQIELDQAIHRSSLEAVLKLHLKI